MPFHRYWSAKRNGIGNKNVCGKFAFLGVLSRVGARAMNLLSHFFVLRFVMARTRTRANRQQEALNIYVVVDGLGNC